MRELLSRIGRFLRRDRASAGLMFALALIPMFVLAGGVVDYVYMMEKKAELQKASDAAVLAAMQDIRATDEELRTSILAYIRSNFGRPARVKVGYKSLELHVDRVDDLVVGVGINLPMEVETAFVRLLGIDRFRRVIHAKARQELGGLEVVMVLDTTGSMEGEKIEELKYAAKDMVDIFAELASRPQMHTVKLGLVPYTCYVNVGTDKEGEPWLKMGNCCGDWPWNGYVGQRPEPYDITDDSYDFVPVPAVPHFVKDVAHNQPWQNQWSTVPEIVPLTELDDPDKVRDFKDDIESLRAFSWTYIPAGLVWGWRVLSPQEPYTGGLDYEDAQRLNVRKVIILMTDGWNTCENVDEPINGFWGVKKCGVPRWKANERTLQLCNRIKDQGILITSVAYAVTDRNVRQLMEQCSNFGYYEPREGELRQVFRDIARRLTRLYLSE